jgi:hypothetical protein
LLLSPAPQGFLTSLLALLVCLQLGLQWYREHVMMAVTRHNNTGSSGQETTQLGL